MSAEPTSKRAEATVSKAAEQAAERAQPEVEAAETAVQEAEEQVAEIQEETNETLETSAQRIRDIVQSEVDKAVKKVPTLDIDAVRTTVENAVSAKLDQLHTAHGGENPSEPVQAVVEEATTPPVEDAPQDAAEAPPPPVDEVAPKPEHWSRRKLWGRS